jgi:DNA (cytosine-5)-methyltransferase 1
MTLTVGSLFSGIGGLDLGLERAGMRCVWQVEIDDYAQRVLSKHWPDVPKFRDVRDVGRHNLEPVDLICGGFPCQPYSLAGKRQASADDRDLWGEFARLIGELRPRWVLAENVPGLLSSEAGRFFGRVLRDLAACGYDAEWDCIPATAVGAHHRRDRVFIVAYPASTSRRQSVRRREQCSQCTNQTNGGSVIRGRHTDVADAISAGLAQRQIFGGNAAAQLAAFERSSRAIWSSEPQVGRMANGVPRRVDRLRGLGNAVVPQVPEYIGRLIIAADAA